MKPDFLRPAQPQRDLRQLNWPKGLKILALAPHPDDFDAVGVTMRFLHDAGHEIHVAVAVTGSGFDEVYGAGLSVDERRNVRIREQTESVRFFGLPESSLEFLHLNNAGDEQLADDAENLASLKALVGRIRPDLVFSPHGNDSNRAHRTMCRFACAIAEKADWPMILMLNRDAKTLDMRADFFIGFDEDEALWKARLLRFHDSQQQRNLRVRGHGFDERVLMLNRAIAGELGAAFPCAEAFEARFFG